MCKKNSQSRKLIGYHNCTGSFSLVSASHIIYIFVDFAADRRIHCTHCHSHMGNTKLHKLFCIKRKHQTVSRETECNIRIVFPYQLQRLFHLRVISRQRVSGSGNSCHCEIWKFFFHCLISFQCFCRSQYCTCHSRPAFIWTVKLTDTVIALYIAGRCHRQVNSRKFMSCTVIARMFYCFFQHICRNLILFFFPAVNGSPSVIGII